MKYIITVGLIIWCVLLRAQNLVTNGSFEEIIDCSTFVSEAIFNDWRPIQNLELGVNYYTYGENCGVNLEGIYECPAQDGIGYIGIRMATMTSSLDYEPKNYIYIELLDSLKGNTCYTFRCYLRRAESIGYFAGNKFGAWFSHAAPPEPQGFFDNVLIDTLPQILSPDTLIFSNAQQWVPFEQNFEVSGGEMFLTLGAFQNIAEMDLYFYYFEGANYNFTLFVDNVSVSECVPDNVESIFDKYEVKLYPNPAESVIYFDNSGFERFDVFDSMGQQLVSNSLINSEMDCSGWPSGFYIFRFTGKKKDVLLKRIFVLH